MIKGIIPLESQPTTPGDYLFAHAQAGGPLFRHARVAFQKQVLFATFSEGSGPVNSFKGTWAVYDTSRSNGEYYAKTYKGGRLDVYRILDVYGITHPAQQHAIKKLLRAGKKKTQPLINDVQEAIDILERWKAMIKEDAESEDSNSNDCNQAAPTI